MNDEEALYCIALQQIPGIGTGTAKAFIGHAGSARDAFQQLNQLLRLPGIKASTIDLGRRDEALLRAEREISFCRHNGIRCLTIGDPDYPTRLNECSDAPIQLFYKGHADLNARHVLSVVGTRRCTPYGIYMCEQIVHELSTQVPDLLIVSGLAYGIDITAHRSALQNDLPTVAVLGHGLDRIYPYAHRKTAVEMLAQGGLLSEYIAGTKPDKPNFIQRNRIVAGMCDAILVVESAEKGGALISASIALSYNKDCFAVPGRSTDRFSVGCNNLIKRCRAAMVTEADDIVEEMKWQHAAHAQEPIQPDLFADLTPDEQQIVDLIVQSPDGLQINDIIRQSGLRTNVVSSLLFQLEYKGIVKSWAGGVYKLIGNRS